MSFNEPLSYTECQALARECLETATYSGPSATTIIAQAQVWATLALAAATAGVPNMPNVPDQRIDIDGG